MTKDKLIVIIIVLLSISLNAQEKFKIIKENYDAEHELGINKYSFVHHVCPDSFFMTELYHDLDYDNMAVIIKDIYNGVTDKDKVQVLYEQVEPAAAKITYSVMDSPKLGNIFVMFTNFNNATRAFDENPDPKDQLARWYFIIDDKFIYRNDVYSTEIENVKLNSEKEYEIIKYYLFDDNSDNDKLIKPLIDKILTNSEDITSQYFTKIYLVQYHLMRNEMDKAETEIKNLDAFYNLNVFALSKNGIFYKMVTAEYEVMKRL